ncbi:MAG: capsule assembly Wzi family protein [Treponema sp.]|nr:capsule assembly Wzi family protein [Treponema sp.]
MKNKFFIIFALLFSISITNLYSSPFEMIPVGDPILEDIRYLSLQTGNAFLSFTPPISQGEIRIFLNSINRDDLSGPGLEAYKRIEERLRVFSPFSISSDHFMATLNINSTLEARVHSNTNIQGEPVYPKIEPILSIPINIFFANTIQLYIEPVLTITPKVYNEINNFGFNVPYEYEHFDSTFPLRAFIAAGGSWWNFQLGRDRLFFGTGHTGSLSFSDNSAYQEFARLSFFSSIFKYSLLINQMPLRITESLYERYDPETADYLTRTTQRYFYLHRIDLLFRNFLSIGIMEGLMVGNSPLEIRYLNPLMIFHNLFSSPEYETGWAGEKMGHLNGSFFSVEINLHFLNNFSIYGQFVMNEFALSVEIGDEPQPPNGLGYMAGINYAHLFNNWASTFYLEFIHTYPYLYMNSSPFASFIQMRRLMSPGQRELYYFIGYPRDTIAITLGANFFNNDTLKLGGKLSWIQRGEHDKDGLVWNWGSEQSHFDERTPSGIPEHRLIATINARWKPVSLITLGGSLSCIYSYNNRHIPGINEIGIQGTFSANFSY